MSTNSQCQICGGTGFVLSRQGVETPCICRNYGTAKPLSAPPLEPLHEPSEKEIIAEAIKLYGDGKDVEDTCRRIGFRDGAGFVIEKLRSRLLPSNPESPSNEWIPVSERFPECGNDEEYPFTSDPVFVSIRGESTIAYFEEGRWVEYKTDEAFDAEDVEDLTHWQPIPKAPSPPTTKD